MFSTAKRGFVAGTGKPVYNPSPDEDDYDPATAPRCSNPACQVDYSPMRAAKGYKSCRDCAEPAKEFVMIPTHKGPGTVMTSTKQLLTVYGDKTSGTGLQD